MKVDNQRENEPVHHEHPIEDGFMHSQSSCHGQLIDIPIKVKKCDTFFCRLRGLMFRKEALKNEGIWLLPCQSIHMFFMNFAIDVIFLNTTLSVVKMCENVQPWKVIPKVKDAHSTMELPRHTIKTYGITLGDKLLLDDANEKLILKRSG